MDDQRTNPWSYSITAVLIAAAIGSGYIGGRKLDSKRPEISRETGVQVDDEQRFEARLWQDPISAAREAANLKSAPPETATQCDFTRQVQARLYQDANFSGQRPGVEILAIIVPSSMYVEDVEARVRSRHAVVNALATLKYRPSNEAHLGLLELGQGQLGVSPKEKPLIPFEWFKARVLESQGHDGSSSVVVLWIPDAFLTSDPVKRLKDLQKALLPDAIRVSCNFSLIGPRGSAMLRDMLRPQQPAMPTLPIRMFSWSATGMDKLLLRSVGLRDSPIRAEWSITDCLRPYGFEFHRVVADDQEIARSLLSELKLRGVDAANPKHHIALVFEQDTFYGRILPISWAAEIAIGKEVPISREKILHDIEEYVPKIGERFLFPHAENLHAFTYLRGIDESRGNRKEGSDSLAASKKEVNNAEGQNQIDYIPRISEELHRIEVDLARNQGVFERGEELKAIGVVGSDFYDKLLVLQALRDRFPRAVFFTTDVDARFLQYRRETRNLLIGSSFGLALSPQLQRASPPFRDTYQTSLYYAVLRAFNFPKLTDGQTRTNVPKPRVFEVGRYGFIDLSENEEERQNGVHPSSTRRSPRARTVLLILVVLFSGSWITIRFVPTLRRWLTPRGRGGLRRGALLLTADQVRMSPMDAQRIAWTKGVSTRSAAYHAALLSYARSGDVAEFVADVNGTMLAAAQYTRGIADTEDARRYAGRASGFLWRSLPGSTTTGRSLLGSAFRRWDIWTGKLRALARERVICEELMESGILSAKSRCRHLNQRLMSTVVFAPLFIAACSFLSWIIIRDHISSSGEPFSLFEGISTWPAVIIRFLAISAALFFLSKAAHDLHASEDELTIRYALPDVPRRRVLRNGISLRKGTYCDNLVRALNSLLVSRRRNGVVDWQGSSEDPEVRATNLWREYIWRGQTCLRVLRTAPWVFLALIFCAALFDMDGKEYFQPGRGPWSRSLAWTLDLIAFGAFLILSFYVADAIRLCRVFIQRLGESSTSWPPETLARFERTTPYALPRDWDEWLDVQVVADRTETVAGLIYYPFIVLALLIVSRSSYFDTWQWSAATLAVYVVCGAFTVFSAFLLQRAAKIAKERAMASISSKIAAAGSVAGTSGSADQREKHLKRMLEEVRFTHRGAFTGYLDNPALKAALLPFSGAGAIGIAQFLFER